MKWSWLFLLALWPALAWAQAPSAADPARDERVDEAASDPLDGLSDAQPLDWKAGVSKAELTLAEPFVVSVEIKHPANVTYELRPGIDFEPFGVREKKLGTSDTDPAVTTLKLTLQPFKTGEQAVPALRFLAQGAQGAQKFDVPAQTVHVLGVIDPEQTKPTMREDFRPLPTRHVTRWWLVALVALVALAAAFLWWWKKRAKRPAAAVPIRPRDPPDVEALARLAALEAEQLVSKGRVREHYFRLTETTRDYLGRLYGFDALEMTTDELLTELRNRPTRGLDFDALVVYLQSCDLVKFARRVPSDGDVKSAMESARTLVARTRPRPADVKAGGAS